MSMPLYRGPETPAIPYEAKFVRVEREIWVAEPKAELEHLDLVEEGGLAERIKQLRRTNPREVDAGSISVTYMRGKIAVDAWRTSAGLRLPLPSSGAREQTVIDIKERTPDAEVTGGVRFHSPFS